ncbi:hypothetical protein E2C01_089484 [Portunus trituberculatus]|uniref:Uncharacterized protein n=1 Tax=Portunus trituberculatus TaxID=210409 RepID=A0A5B7JC49_PORTR|nr:hypothetical protein [Portunus trituberculatus]
MGLSFGRWRAALTNLLTSRSILLRVETPTSEHINGYSSQGRKTWRSIHIFCWGLAGHLCR